MAELEQLILAKIGGGGAMPIGRLVEELQAHREDDVREAAWALLDRRRLRLNWDKKLELLPSEGAAAG